MRSTTHESILRAEILAALLLALLGISEARGATTITTLAGPSGQGIGSADGTGRAASFYSPLGVAVDASGNVYVADAGNDTIRKITSAGVVTTFAGTANAPGSADGTGATARFNSPSSVAVDASGNVYVADSGNEAIRKITPAGVVSTLAGGTAGSADGTGSAASFSLSGFFTGTGSVAVDASGNVYVADVGNNTIRKITLGGVVTTLAGKAGSSGSLDGTGAAAQFDAPDGVAVDASGTVYVADKFNCTIRKITPGGVVTTLAGTAGTIAVFGGVDGSGSAATFYYPRGLAVDSAGNVYVADDADDTLRKITPAGVVSTLAGTPVVTGSSDGPGNLASFFNPGAIAVDTAGNVYVADTGNSIIRQTTSAGIVTTFAGSAPAGSPGSVDATGYEARFNLPAGVAADASGNAYVADTGNNIIRKITPAGVVTTLAGKAGVIGSLDGAGGAASFSKPNGVAVDASGNVYVADSGNNTIRKITSAGVVTTLAGTAGAPGTADGTGSAAGFYNPSGIAVDSSGNVYVADEYNYTIRKITATGIVTTLAGTARAIGNSDGTGAAASFRNPQGVAVDASGVVYVADTTNNSIRIITPAGVVTTLAGISASLNRPTGVAVDASGNVYVVNALNYNICEITPSGVITSLAGKVFAYGSTDGVGSAALFHYPTGIAVDASGKIYVADTENDSIRVGNSTGGPAVITSPLTATGAEGVPFTFTLTASGSSSVVFTATGLPPGLTLSGSTISGTPTGGGIFNVALTASDGVLPDDARTLVLSISNPPPVLTSISTTSASAGSAGFALTLTGSNFVSTSLVNWQGLPDLIPASQSATQITVNVPATYLGNQGTPNITVTNPGPGGGTSVAYPFTVFISGGTIGSNGAPTITSPFTAGATLGTAFVYEITVAGGVLPVTYSVSGLPLGFTLVGSTISGTFTVGGVAQVFLTAASPGGSVSQLLTIAIANPSGAASAPPVLASPPSIPNAPVLAGTSITFGAGASDTAGDLLGYTWDFGDGTTGFGSTVNKTYPAPGIYLVTLTVTNGTSAITSVVDVAVIASSDSSLPLLIKTASIKFNFLSVGKDTFTVTGTLNLPVGFALNGTSVLVALFGFQQTASLGKTGSTPNRTFKLTGKFKSGVLTTPGAKFIYNVKNKPLFNLVQAAGFTKTTGNPALVVPLYIGINTYTFAGNMNLKYTIKSSPKGPQGGSGTQR